MCRFPFPKGIRRDCPASPVPGKVPSLNLIGALDSPTSGKVLIAGKDLFSMKDSSLTIFRRRNIGFIFQSFNLIPELTVEQNIIFPVLLDYQKPDRKYLEGIVKRAELAGTPSSSAKSVIRRSAADASRSGGR